MKYILLSLILFEFTIGIHNAYSQQAETGTSATSPDWHLGGNSGTVSTPNRFGTFWNSPIYTFTDADLRMRLNGTMGTGGIFSQPFINGFSLSDSVNTSGYLGLGNNSTTVGGHIWDHGETGPFSLLHLNGTGNFPQQFGYRPWMKCGITFTDNGDRMYIGMRRNGVDDVTDAVFNWSDNNGTTAGPDNLVFNFTSGDGSPNTDLDGNSPNGREVMRMTATGNVGVGPRFTNASQPQSQFHLSGENSVNTWFQLSNQTGTSQTTGFQGTRFGIAANNAYLYNQEDGALLFGTNLSTNVLSYERVRISQLGTDLVYNNPDAIADATRVSISQDPTNPINRPRSLLHLGYNTSMIGPVNMQDGHRNWMDVGMFVADGTDNVYLGLKSEPDDDRDRQDAVLAWGDNQTTYNGHGPDNFRFIFARSAISPGDAVSGAADGLEVGRFTPTGEFGIGNFYNNTPLLGAPSQKLDVDGNGRFRFLPDASWEDNALIQFVTIDANGVLHWRNMPAGGTVTGAYNGTSLDATGQVQLGEDMSTTPTGLANLVSDRYTSMSNFNIHYDGQGFNGVVDAYGIGVPYDSLRMRGKLHVHHHPFENFQVDGFNQGHSAAGYFRNTEMPQNNTFHQFMSGVRGISDGPNLAGLDGKNWHYGGYFQAFNHVYGNAAVRGEVITPVIDGESANQYINFGGTFVADVPHGWFVIGSSGEAYDGIQQVIGVTGYADGGNLHETSHVDGGRFEGLGGGLHNHGVHGIADPSETDGWAGYFDGSVLSTTGVFATSDANLKTNITTFANGLELIQQLRPVSYSFNQDLNLGINLPTGPQIGLIAQEVEQVLPELVKNFQHREKIPYMVLKLKPEPLSH